MKTSLILVCFITLSSFLYNSHISRVLPKKSEEVEILDTIKFEGIFVLDEINSELYLIEKEEFKTIKVSYKSNKDFLKHFKKLQKLDFLASIYLKNILEKYHNYKCTSRDFDFHNSQINGISVLNENGKHIRISFLNIRLVKTKISKSVLDQYILTPYFVNDNRDNLILYSFLYCAYDR